MTDNSRSSLMKSKVTTMILYCSQFRWFNEVKVLQRFLSLLEEIKVFHIENTTNQSF